MTHDVGVVIPFPGDERRRRFLLQTAALVRALTAGTPSREDMLRLHTAVDLRRPRLQRFLADAEGALGVLARVTDRIDADLAEHASSARHLAELLEASASS